MKSWVCIDVICPEDLAEEVAAEVVEVFGVTVEMPPGGIRFYLVGERLLPQWEESLQALLKRAQKAHEIETSLTYQTSLLQDDDWADRWKVHFKPLRVGRRFLICPTWEEVHPADTDRIIRLDPGRAFGTGQHETTRLCLEWLEEWAEDERHAGLQSLLDVGTGSGILAMGGVILGFQPVIALDNDPEAIEVALENAALNGLSERIRFFEGSIGDVEGPFDVVVSNIQAYPLIDMAVPMVHAVRRGGRLVLSGILVEQREIVRDAYEAQGLKLSGVKTAGEWCLLVFA